MITIRRPLTREEVKTLIPAGTVVMPHGSAASGLFVVWANDHALTPGGVVKTLLHNARTCSFDLEILYSGRGPSTPCLVQIRATFAPGKVETRSDEEEGLDQPLNTEIVRVAGVVTRRPANLDFAPKPRRLATLCHFIDAGYAFVEPSATLETAFVDRLFTEGMLERHPENPAQFRPTSGGREWFKRHFCRQGLR